MNKTRDGAEIRRQRVQTLMDLIERHSDLAEIKVKGLFYLQSGLSLAKIEEYIGELEQFGLIERNDGKLRVVK